ncbi:hypothetical protein M9458_006325, partial [Cirrhinus mrigala]
MAVYVCLALANFPNYLNPACKAPGFHRLRGVDTGEKSPVTVCSQEDLTCSTPDPEPSPPSPRGAEHKPEPTNDGEPEPTVTDEPSHLGTTEAMQNVRPGARAGYHAHHEGGPTSAYCTTAEGGPIVDLGKWKAEGDLLPPPSSEPSVSLAPEFSLEGTPISPSSPERAHVSKFSPERGSVPKSSQERTSVPKGSPESPEAHKCPLSRPPLPLPPLSSSSHSAHPQPTICAVGSLQICQSLSTSWLVGSPVLIPKSRTPPRPVDPAAPSWSLLSAVARHSNGSTGLPHPSGSTLVCRRPPYTSGLHCSHCTSSLRLHLGLSSTTLHLGTPLLPLRLVPLAPSGSSIPSAPPWSSVTPPQPFGFTPP